MNSKFKQVFEGKVVNKAQSLNTGVDEFPRYVLEYLIDNYCKEETFNEDLSLVTKRLKENFVHGAEAEKIRHFIKERRRHSIIANLEVRLVETEDKYWATIGSLNEKFANIPESIVRQYPMLLSGGMWGTIELTYDETEIHSKKIRPFKVVGFTPFQISLINLTEYVEKRHQFSSEEWLDILINSCGLNPEKLSKRQKMLYLCRCIPMVESNTNIVELGPRETGKTYLYRNISYYATLLSGGKATPAQLFMNLNTGQIGMVGNRDVVVFDEIANTEFTDPRALVSIMQGYMQDAKFNRGKKEVLAFGSLVFVGNIDVQGNLPHEKYYHLFEPFPEYLQEIAFLDRIHAYIPGWEIPKLSPSSYSKDYGFITDYFCEIMHELRKTNPYEKVKSRFMLVDSAGTTQGISGRDQRAVMKSTSGLLKLLYPDGEVSDKELSEILLIACELRQRVRDQLHLIAPGEFEKVKICAQIIQTGEIITPFLEDSQREHKVALPEKPSIGEVIGLGISGERGVVLLFEMQATKGNGRIVPLGSIGRVMKESIEAAAQYVKAKSNELDISPEWRENYDVAILATYMAIPKEGPSAGITVTTGIVSALTGRRVRNDLAMTGEITIMGKVLPVGGIQAKILKAAEAGITEVIIPRANETEVRNMPSNILQKIKITAVDRIEEVLKIALLEE
jgi:ATP-dependent Lon protease